MLSDVGFVCDLESFFCMCWGLLAVFILIFAPHDFALKIAFRIK